MLGSKRTWAEVAGAVVAVAAIAGASGASGSTSAPESSVPMPTPRTVEKTVTVTNEVTPQACVDALSYADEGFGYAADGFGHASAGLTAISEGDWNGAEQEIAGLTDVNDSLGTLTPKYRDAKAACLAGAK